MYTGRKCSKCGCDKYRMRPLFGGKMIAECQGKGCDAKYDPRDVGLRT